MRSTTRARRGAWTRKHRSWLTSVRFADHASQATLADYLHAHDVLIARRDQVEAELAKLALSAPCAHTVARLRCLRGIDTLTALGLCAEIGEWERFDHPDQLSAYLGIVPSEHTTGRQRRLGVDHQGRLHPRPSAAGRGRLPLPPRRRLSARRSSAASAGSAPEIINISWRAQRRLNARWRQLKDARHKPDGIVAVAIARELAAYCWEIATWTLIRPFRRHPCRRATPSRTQPVPPSTRDPQEAHQLTLTHSQPVAAGEAARASRLAHTTPRSVA